MTLVMATRFSPDCIDLVAGHEIQQLVQRDHALHPGQRGTETTVHAVTQSDVLRLASVPVDVEGVRVGERPLVPVGRTHTQQHRVSGGNRDAVQLNVFQAVPDEVLGGRLPAQQLLDRSGNLAAIIEQHLPLIRMFSEGDHRIAHQLGDRLGAGTAQHRREAGDLDVIELGRRAVALDLDGDQIADHVVLRIGATS